MPAAVGVMSGTSCDGVSAALVDFSERAFRVAAYRTFPYPAPVAQLLRSARDLNGTTLAQLNILVGELSALAILRILRNARRQPSEIAVVGSHGHTIYHGPNDAIPCTLQVGEPAIIAERTGIPVVSNFRMRDMAAGGQGAPLIPFFDHHFFGRGAARALQNIGGIANVSFVGTGIAPLAFDTGPGNCLIDAAVRRITRERQTMDRGGRLAARGRIDHAAVRRLADHPYFRQPPPKSTGPELFNESWLRRALGARWAARGDEAVATLTYFTAWTIAESYRRFLPSSPREIIVNGGGCLNRTLMRHLAQLLAPLPVRSIAEYGLPPQAKEPAAFAFLGLRAWQGRINHSPSTTGASAPRVLGTITPGARRVRGWKLEIGNWKKPKTSDLRRISSFQLPTSNLQLLPSSFHP